MGKGNLITRATLALASVRCIPEPIAAALSMLALSCAYYAAAIFGGRIIAPVDFIFYLNFFSADMPTGYAGPANALLTDPILKFIPWQYAARYALGQGQMPLWNPYIYAGAPLFANGESALLYPVQMLGYLLPLPWALNLSAVIHMSVAGLGMYVLTRALNLRRLGATLAAISFMLGGSLTVWRIYPLGMVYAWMPLVFLFSHRLISTGYWHYASLIGLTVATQILAGHHQTVFIELLAWGFFCVYRLREEWPKRGLWPTLWLLVPLGGGLFLGVLLAGVQLVPFYEWLQQGAEVQRRLQLAPTNWLEFLIELASLALLVLPNLYGNPSWGMPNSFFRSNFIEQTIYMGLVPLCLALMALIGSPPPTRRRVHFFAALGVGCLLLALHVPGFDLINRLPIFNLVATPRYRLVFSFCLAILAGFGLDQLVGLPTGSQRLSSLRRGTAVLALGAAVIPLSAFWVLRVQPPALMVWQRIHDNYASMLQAFSPSYGAMYIPAGFAAILVGVIILRQRVRIGGGTLGILLITLTVADLVIFGYSFTPIVPQTYLFPPTRTSRVIDQIQATGTTGRVLSLNDDLAPGTNIPYRFADIGGSEFPSLYYQQFALAMGGQMTGPARIKFPVYPSRLANLLGVRFVVSSVPQTVPTAARLHPVFHNDWVLIYENPDALPRARIVHTAEVYPDDQGALQRLRSDSFDLRDSVILNELPPFALQRPPTGRYSEATIVEDRPQLVRVVVHAAAAGLLVLADSYYPGWQATVDTRPVPVLRADHALRAVAVPAGTHEVVFRYQVNGLVIGVGLTALGLMLTMTGLVWGYYRCWLERRRGV